MFCLQVCEVVQDPLRHSTRLEAGCAPSDKFAGSAVLWRVWFRLNENTEWTTDIDRINVPHAGE